MVAVTRRLIDMGRLGTAERTRILREAYSCAQRTYGSYWKRYRISGWSFEKLKLKVKSEYQLAVIYRTGGRLLFYLGVSKPHAVGRMQYTKIGFMDYGSGVKSKADILRDGIGFLGRRLSQQPDSAIYIELPYGYAVTKFVFENMGFRLSKNRLKTSAILGAFGKSVKRFRGYNHITADKPFYSWTYLKVLGPGRQQRP